MIEDPRTGGPRVPDNVLLDLSRLVYAGWSRTPTGIARVELAYAEHFIALAPPSLRFVVRDGLGRLRLANRRQAVDFVRAIGRYWRSNTSSHRTFAAVAFRAIAIHVVLLVDPWGAIRRLINRNPHSVYIIPSQLHLERPRLIERLKRSGKVSLVYFVHDILPALFPEYFLPYAEKSTHRRMQTAARFADAIIVNSRDTAENFSRAFGNGVECPPIVVAPLGLSIAIPPPTAPSLSGSPYFVMIGTIEPRKNHLMILNVWRSMRMAKGPDTPRLILIGGRGWENENIIDMLERSPFLRGVVEERPQVSDDEMVRLLRGARALLMPSFGEGYGMPVAEALALGVPALCSDTPALREVGGNVPEYFDPLDGPAWRSAILDYSAADSPRRSAQLKRLASWRPTTWEDHFQKVLALLQTLEPDPHRHKGHQSEPGSQS